MWTKVVRRVSVADASLEAVVNEALTAPRPGVQALSELAISFAPPVAGWISFHLGIPAGPVLRWELSNARDPFRRVEETTANYGVAVTFVSWLEEVASGKASALAVDLEGPVGVLAVTVDADDDWVGFLVYSTNGGILLNGRILRRTVLKQFYEPLVAYWEGPMLTENWPEWAQEDQVAPWPIRFSLLAEWLANSA